FGLLALLTTILIPHVLAAFLLLNLPHPSVAASHHGAAAHSSLVHHGRLHLLHLLRHLIGHATHASHSAHATHHSHHAHHAAAHTHRRDSLTFLRLCDSRRGADQLEVLDLNPHRRVLQLDEEVLYAVLFD